MRTITLIIIHCSATPEDVAPAMAFLLCEEARFITGVTLPVTGGSAIV